MDAVDLQVGDKVRGSDGASLAVTTARSYVADLTAYNLTVDDIHTYYAGTTPVLFHNSCPELVARDELQPTHSTYVVDGHHRLVAARLAGLDEVTVTDVTDQLLESGFKGYRDMADVLDRAQSFFGNRLNQFKLR